MDIIETDGKATSTSRSAYPANIRRGVCFKLHLIPRLRGQNSFKKQLDPQFCIRTHTSPLKDWHYMDLRFPSEAK